MDPFARKMWRAGLGFAGAMLTLFAALTIFYVHEWPNCPDRVIGESASPDKKWTATVLERRCGVEAPFITRVNLRRSGPLQRGFFSGQVQQGNVFAAEQDAAGAGISLVWLTDNTLMIRCAHCSPTFIRQRNQQWRGIRIQYDLP